MILSKAMVSLVSVIENEIRLAGGWIGFDAFMQRALYEPNLGYYSGGGEPFGNRDPSPIKAGPGLQGQGDFITGPMLGPWLAHGVWSFFKRLQDGHPHPWQIREFGAGRGDLAAELMRLARHDHKPVSLELIELSAGLMESQRSRTEGLITEQQTIRWSSQLAPGFSGLVFGNEVLDAMPVKVFEWIGDDRVLEWGVEVAGLQAETPFRWASRPAGETLHRVVIQRQRQMAAAGLDWPRGYRGEWCPWLAPWIESIYASMDWGALLLIDYGFARHELDHPGRSSGSLCAHVQHRRLDAPQELINAPGTRDLTAHVDFSELAACAAQAGFSVDGFATQSRFLMNLGVLDHAQALMSQAKNMMEQTRLTQSLQMLLLESEMGEVFKVMLLTKNLSSEKIADLTSFGFESGDRRAAL